jgi:hypothetical protein
MKNIFLTEPYNRQIRALEQESWKNKKFLSCSQFVQICMIQEQHHKEVTVL